MRVVPVRFTDDLPAMRRFLTALGLTAEIESDGGGWIALTANAGGGVGLHSASSSEGGFAPGVTNLSFESEEPLEQVAERLHAAGFDAVILDENFGRSLRTTDPDGVELQINEAMTDTYGYTVA